MVGRRPVGAGPAAYELLVKTLYSFLAGRRPAHRCRPVYAGPRPAPRNASPTQRDRDRPRERDGRCAMIELQRAAGRAAAGRRPRARALPYGASRGRRPAVGRRDGRRFSVSVQPLFLARTRARAVRRASWRALAAAGRRLRISGQSRGRGPRRARGPPARRTASHQEQVQTARARAGGGRDRAREA